jgi:hypothetical protein
LECGKHMCEWLEKDFKEEKRRRHFCLCLVLRRGSAFYDNYFTAKVPVNKKQDHFKDFVSQKNHIFGMFGMLTRIQLEFSQRCWKCL